MKRYKCKLPAIALIFALCLGTLIGCHAPEPGASATELSDYLYVPAIGATFGARLPEEVLPPVVSGPLLTEPLAVASWDSDRCERTSYCQYGEVESGFYGSTGYSLGYAEKTDLDSWYVVCPYPDCKHVNERYGCPANVDGNFILRNGRIYYPGAVRQYE